MIKIIFSMVMVVFFTMSTNVSAQNVSFDDGTTWNCDQNFAPTPVRYNKLYSFFDTWHNNSSTNTYINNFYIKYQHASFLGQ